MAEIRVGQEWKEKRGKLRRMVVTGYRRNYWVDLKPIANGKMPIIKDRTRLNRDFDLVFDPEQPRRIALELAKDTTATECGSCILLGNGDDAFFCRGFDKRAVSGRLPECQKAEVK